MNNEDDIPLAQRLLALQKERLSVIPTKKSTVSSSNKRIIESKTNPIDIKKPKASSDPSSNRAKNTETKKAQFDVKIKKDPGMIPKSKIKPDPGNSSNGTNAENFSNEDEHRWWEGEINDGSVKWNTLEHNGLYFPPPYEKHGVHMFYDGQKIHLEPEAEEVASFFAAIIGTDHYENEIFRKNFFQDFRWVLKSINSKWSGIIRELNKCDFSPIAEYLNIQREKKKQMTKEEKEVLKKEKLDLEEKYGFCFLDGRKEKVGNFRVEPPGLFRGRGKHPKAGKLKQRVHPEQITINIGHSAKIPTPPLGHSWGKIIHDNTVTWLATWIENINRSQKYVFLAAGSSLKGQSDLKKFEIARKLKAFVHNIRKVNSEELRSKEMEVRQRATALWLIDRLALRAGNEKGDDEADTVGCCSLRLEHIKLVQPNIVVFDFLGKDSIRYHNEVPVDPIIFKNLGIFMRAPKISSDPIFDRLTTSSLNKYLSGLMPGLTAKVFRTYNASHTFQEELLKTPQEGTIQELILAYNRANREVAILCNHQRAVPKTHEQSMEKLEERILSMKYQRFCLRKELKEVIGKKELKKVCPESLQDELDLDTATIQRKRKEEKILNAEKEKEKALKAKEKGLEYKPTIKKPPKGETLIKKFYTLSSRIESALVQKTDRHENKSTALGTSKTNYIDPRITTRWCQDHNVPLEKMFNKSLQEKFKWAMSVPEDWEF